MRWISLILLCLALSSLGYVARGSASKDRLEQHLQHLFYEQRDPCGHQVLHANTLNKPYEACPDAKLFVDTNFQLASCCSADAEVLQLASTYVAIDGEFLALGVGSGKAVNFLAALNPKETIYCFDVMTEKEEVAPFLPNVHLDIGTFKQTLPSFILETLQGKSVAFVFINCSSYESTKEAFHYLKGAIADQTILVFDEFYNFPGFRQQEMQALEEFLEENNFFVEYLAYNANHEQVAVRLHKKWNQW